VSWAVEFTDQFGDWWETLTAAEQFSIDNAVQLLEQHGPALGRPLVDTIRGSAFPNMKELRPSSGNNRILFAFDPRRIAILLIGGNKTNLWTEWYEVMIPVADRLYTEHLAELEREGR
jgi:hypothetical protein